MNAQTQDFFVRHGAKLLMATSIAVVTTLIVRGPPPVLVLGYAEVVPVRLATLEIAKVSKTLVEPGQVVAAGDIVAQLDPALIQGRIAILMAELERHGAALIADEDLAKSSVLTAEAEMEESSARLGGARKALELADANLAERKRQVEAGLAGAEALASMEVDAAQLRADVDRYDRQYKHRTAVLTEMRARLATAENEPARALLEGTRAENVTREELALLQTRLDALTLRAPTASRVSALHYRVGEVLPQGAAVVELMPLETKRVIACLPERYPVVVRAGSTAELRGTTGAGLRSGTVVDVVGLISEAPERCKQRPNETGWVRPVRILVEGGGLVPGERFDVSFGAAPAKPAAPEPS
jgi:multidrug resistance efflux pump